jgi:hypothetical protein
MPTQNEAGFVFQGMYPCGILQWLSHNNMKTSKQKSKGVTKNVLWVALRDTAIYFAMFLFIINVRVFHTQKRIIPGSLEQFKITLIIFLMVFIANIIACALGSTTEDDDLGEPSTGLNSKVPGTFIGTAIGVPLSFLILLYLGVIKL